MQNAINNLLQGIDTVIIRVSNFTVSKEWYMEKLGFSVLFEDANMQLAVLDTQSGVSLTIWGTQQAIVVNKDTASYPIFKTPDAAALRQELVNRGVKADEIIEDAYTKYFMFYDPDGNVLEACQVHD
jgi:Lactoylglutathione lyase and related lyases